MKRFFTLILIASITLLVHQNFAQNIGDYAFAYIAGSYTEVTGGTVLGTITNDDQAFVGTTTGGTGTVTGPGFPIGFNFTYHGVTYDKFAVNNNGWMRLATGATFSMGGAVYNPISTSGLNTENAICAIARDLQGQTGSELSYLLEGTSPNQCLVIQWKNYRRYNVTGESYNFQIRLYETLNSIKFVYGNFTVNYTLTSHPQVGIKGLLITDFHNRTTTANWTTTAKGTLNSSTSTLSTTVKPPSGTTFTFTTPSLLNPQSFAASPVSSTQISLTFTTNIAGDNVLIIWDGDNTFNVPAGEPPAVDQPFAGGTVLYNGTVSPQLHTNLAPNEDYHYMAYSYNGSVYSSGLHVTTATFCEALTGFPYEQGFEGTWPPGCWTDPVTANYGWFKNTYGGSHSGSGWAYCNLANSELFAPLMTIPPDCMLKFWYRAEGAGYPQNLAVKIGSEVIHQITGAVNIYYEQVELSLAAYAGQTVAVSFLGQSGAGGSGWGICIDDVYFAPSSALEGYVYDFDGNPLAGATVEKSGGISTTSGPDGYYILSPLDNGPQAFQCSKTGYNYVVEIIDIPVGLTINQNFTLTNPEMTVEPGSIYAILGATATGSYNLEIKNDGNGPLDFTATEISTEPCEYTIELTDAYGDGWNGGILDVMVNGIVVLDDITLLPADLAGPKYWTFNVSGGDEITTMFYPGSYAYECVYKIYNNVMAEVWWAEGGGGPQNITSGQLLGACDVEWLSVDMVFGYVDPDGGTQNIMVTLDAAQTPPALAPGVTYTADILFTSGTGIEPVTIPVTLVVTDAGLAGPQDLKLFIVDQLTGKIKLRWNYIPLRDMVFAHFAIFKNDELIGTTTEDFYLDINTEPGVYCYKVYAIYEGNVFSDPSNVVCVPYPLGPGVPIANWALLLGGLLMASFVFIRFSKRT